MILMAMALLALDADKQKVATADGKPADPDKQMVCKMIARTGSRMHAQRYCLPAFQWQVMNNSTRRNVGEMQSKSQMEQPPTF